jgi:ankyrin repeat protein
LLEHDIVDPNIADDWGETPLSFAIRYKRETIADLLRQSGKIKDNVVGYSHCCN